MLQRGEPQSNILDSLMIAAPCNVGWDNMQGTDKVRFCHQCNLNVYNTSKMTGSELQQLLATDAEMPCLRLYRRADGTVITEDCPVGLRKIRDRFRQLGRLVASTFAFASTVVSALAQGVGLTPFQRIEGPRDPHMFRVDPTSIVGVPRGSSRAMQTGAADSKAAIYDERARQALKAGDVQLAEALFGLAIGALGSGNHDSAFIKSIEEERSNCLETIARKKQDCASEEDGLVQFEEYCRINKPLYRWYIDEGDKFKSLGQFYNAETAYKKAQKNLLEPISIREQGGLGRVLAKATLEPEKRLSALYHLQALQSQNLHKHFEAIKPFFEKTLDLDCGNSQARLDYKSFLRENSRHEDAEQVDRRWPLPEIYPVMAMPKDKGKEAP